VEDVVPVEEIRGHRLAVILRVLVQVGREVERQGRSSIGVEAEIGRVVAILVLIRMNIVPARDGEVGARETVRVVPPERRCVRIGRVLDERPRSVIRALLWKSEDAITGAVQNRRGRGKRQEAAEGFRLRGRFEWSAAILERNVPVIAHDVVFLVEHLACLCVDGHPPQVLATLFFQVDLPGQPQRAGVYGLIDELCDDRTRRDPAVGEDGFLLRPELDFRRFQRFRRLETDVRRRCVRRSHRTEHRRGAIDALLDLRQETGAEAENRTIGRDIEVAVGPEDLDAADALPEVDVADPGVIAPGLAGHDEVRDVGGGEVHVLRVRACVFLRDIDRPAGGRTRQRF
jgi:hypothetical protein